jgi:hypothetical protein
MQQSKVSREVPGAGRRSIARNRRPKPAAQTAGPNRRLDRPDHPRACSTIEETTTPVISHPRGLTRHSTGRRPVRLVVAVFATVFGFAAGPPALAANGPAAANPPTPKTLAAMKAEADAVQAELTAGARSLDAARSKLAGLQQQATAATSAADAINVTLVGLRDQLAGYAADLYIHPAVESAMTALTAGPDLEASMQGVQLLAIVNDEHAEVLREVVVDEQRSQVLQTQATQAVAAARVVQNSITAKVRALQAKSVQAAKRLTAGQAAYQTELARVAALRLAAAKAARDEAARALAERKAAALRADAAGSSASPSECAAAANGPYPSGAWGGFSDGFVPSSQLCAIVGGGRLRPDAAVAFNRMSQAFAQAFGSNLCVSDSYRSYSQQVAVFRQRPSLAAVPGTSNHGWGLATDLGCGVQRYGSAQYRWMTANAGRFGWVHPSWAVHNPFEPWHWEFGHLGGTGGT